MRPIFKLSGQRLPPPRPGWLVAIYAISGWLLLARLTRILSRLVIAHRQPVEIELDGLSGGLVVSTRVEVLARVLRESRMAIPRGGLLRATREVRYPQAPTYVGLAALALGSYFGAGLAVDGIRAASATLFELGSVVVLLGLGIDFLLVSVLPGSRGRCRVVLVPRRGQALCVGDVDIEAADRVIGEIAKQVEPAGATKQGAPPEDPKPAEPRASSRQPVEGTAAERAKPSGASRSTQAEPASCPGQTEPPPAAPGAVQFGAAPSREQALPPAPDASLKQALPPAPDASLEQAVPPAPDASLKQALPPAPDASLKQTEPADQADPPAGSQGVTASTGSDSRVQGMAAELATNGAEQNGGSETG